MQSRELVFDERPAQIESTVAVQGTPPLNYAMVLDTQRAKGHNIGFYEFL